MKTLFINSNSYRTRQGLEHLSPLIPRSAGWTDIEDLVGLWNVDHGPEPFENLHGQVGFPTDPAERPVVPCAGFDRPLPHFRGEIPEMHILRADAQANIAGKTPPQAGNMQGFMENFMAC